MVYKVYCKRCGKPTGGTTSKENHELGICGACLTPKEKEELSRSFNEEVMFTCIECKKPVPRKDTVRIMDALVCPYCNCRESGRRRGHVMMHGSSYKGDK